MHPPRMYSVWLVYDPVRKLHVADLESSRYEPYLKHLKYYTRLIVLCVFYRIM